MFLPCIESPGVPPCSLCWTNLLQDTSSSELLLIELCESSSKKLGQIISCHIDTLIYVAIVTGNNNVRALCHLYDLVESNVRSTVVF